MFEENNIESELNLKLTEKQLNELEKLSSAMGNVSKSNLIRIAITECIMKYKDLLEDSKKLKYQYLFYNFKYFNFFRTYSWLFISHKREITH
jgi:metal-responsive CopG/Arc/MetJ family transcriptional regulator